MFELPGCASEEEKAPHPSEAVLPSTSGDGGYEESFPDCPQLTVCWVTILLLMNCASLGEGGKKKKNSKQNGLLELQKCPSVKNDKV